MKVSLFVSWVLCLLVGAIASDTKYDEDYVRSLKGSNGLVRLNDKTFDNVIGGPRDYTVMLLLTAEAPQYGCNFCRIIGPAFETAANSWNHDHPNGEGLYFAVADISDAKDVFRKLELTHAPLIWTYKATDKKSPVRPGIGYDQYQFPQSEIQLPQLLQYIETSLGHKITVHEPFKWDRFIMAVTTTVMVIGVIKVAWAKILNILQKKQLWTAVSLVCILMFTAGHMFNMIRKTPYIVSDGQGGATYFVGGHSNQIAVETQIIALVYAILAFGTISLVVKVPKIKSDNKQSFVVYILVALIFLAFSFLLSKFKVKNGGYPFGLLNIF